MIMLKRTALAVLTLSTTVTFAGTMGPVCTPGLVTTPCDPPAWSLGAQALYLKSSFAGIGYYGSTTTNASERFNSIKPAWGWGFQLEGAYRFSTGNDLNINWYHLNKSFQQYTQLGALEYTGTLKAEPKWDAVNIEFGQHLDLGAQAKVRYHGGLALARVRSYNNFQGVVVATGEARTATQTDSYDGLGPRLGADLSYNWGYGFNIYANAASALFVGTGSFIASDTYTAVFSPLISGSQIYIVPELEAKLGANYNVAMAQGNLMLTAGWMWINYFNIQQQQSPDGGGNVVSSNFGLQGPYVGLKWMGNV